jgi:ribonuclease P protein component
VGRRVGGAVVRNRVRRRLRELARRRLGRVAPGWDLVIAARAPAATATSAALGAELDRLLARAKVLAAGSEEGGV